MKTSTTFVLGLIAGATVVYAMQRKDVRKVAIAALDKGMKLKDDATRLIESLKEGASDMIAEAATSMEESKVEEDIAPVKEAPAKRRAPAKKATPAKA